MSKTYWNSEGKYQEWYNKVSETAPDMYDTDNKYMNIFLAISKIYYDVYNNGGGNIDDCYEDKVYTVKNYVRFDIFKAIHDLEYLEEKINEIFEKLMKEDLSFGNYGFWNEWKQRLISRNKHDGEDWKYITCGTVENVEKEFSSRKDYGFVEV